MFILVIILCFLFHVNYKCFDCPHFVKHFINWLISSRARKGWRRNNVFLKSKLWFDSLVELSWDTGSSFFPRSIDGSGLLLAELSISVPSTDMNSSARLDTFSDAFSKNFITFALGLLINCINGAFVYTYFKGQVFQRDPRWWMDLLSFPKDKYVKMFTVKLRRFDVHMCWISQSWVLFLIYFATCCDCNWFSDLF